MKSAASGQTFGSVISDTYYNGVGFVEWAATRSDKIKEKADLTGLRETLERDPTIALALEEIRINNGSIAELSPEMRLMLSTTMGVVKVVSLNKLASRNIEKQAEQNKRVQEMAQAMKLREQLEEREEKKGVVEENKGDVEDGGLGAPVFPSNPVQPTPTASLEPVRPKESVEYAIVEPAEEVVDD